MLKTLVLVDDDQDDIDFFSRALQETKSSANLHPFLDCQEMLLIMQNMSVVPDLVMLDVNMPSMTGWECLKEFRKLLRFHNVPVIVYSTSSPKNYSRTLKDSGAIAFYEKASDFEKFKEFVHAVISTHPMQLRDTLQQLLNSHLHSLIIA